MIDVLDRRLCLMTFHPDHMEIGKEIYRMILFSTAWSSFSDHLQKLSYWIVLVKTGRLIRMIQNICKKIVILDCPLYDRPVDTDDPKLSYWANSQFRLDYPYNLHNK